MNEVDAVEEDREGHERLGEAAFLRYDVLQAHEALIEDLLFFVQEEDGSVEKLPTLLRKIIVSVVNDRRVKIN